MTLCRATKQQTELRKISSMNALPAAITFNTVIKDICQDWGKIRDRDAEIARTQAEIAVLRGGDPDSRDVVRRLSEYNIKLELLINSRLNLARGIVAKFDSFQQLGMDLVNEYRSECRRENRERFDTVVAALAPVVESAKLRSAQSAARQVVEDPGEPGMIAQIRFHLNSIDSSIHPTSHCPPSEEHRVQDAIGFARQILLDIGFVESTGVSK